MMNYSKIIVLSSLFLFKVAISSEPQELLAQWKAMAEEERQRVIDCLQKEYRPMEEIEIKYSIGLWCDELSYNKVKKDWLSRNYVDHIKVIYNDSLGRYSVVYLQLEDSVLHYNVTGFFANVIFRPRYFNYDEKKVRKTLENLIGVLPLDRNPKIKIYRSHKDRLVKRWISTSEIDDLYSVCIDHYDPEKDPWRIDWSRQNRRAQTMLM